MPTEAEAKSKVEDGGRARLRISRFSRLKKERINSRFAGVMRVQRGEVPETMAWNSLSARVEDVVLRRWLKREAMADRSDVGGEGGMRRTRRPGELSVQICSYDLYISL